MIISDSDPLDLHHYRLDPSTIDIWQLSLHESHPQSAAILHPDEVARQTRFHFDRHRRRFGSARTQLREILAAYLGQTPASLIFQYNKHGKPEVVNPAGLYFNLSHSGDRALLAIGKDHPMGIDLEQYSARPYLGIASHLFSEDEQKALKAADLKSRPAMFFHIWAQKEAFIKACGLGLAYPTQRFSVPVMENTADIYDNLHKITWKMQTFMPAIAVAAALCYHPSIQTLRKFRWNSSQSYKNAFSNN